MMKKYLALFICFGSFSLCSAEEGAQPQVQVPPQNSVESPSHAQVPPQNSIESPSQAQVPPQSIVESPSEIITKEHSITFGDETLKYESQIGTLPIKGDDGKETAHIFFTAYLAKDAKAPRPITFCFNGGPGSASIWLHMGFLGPKRVVIQDEKSSSPPAEYRDNPYSLLKVSDLVFIDPVSTGFSKVVDGVNVKSFHGVEEDMASVANFIRTFLTHAKRWDSPKYVLGESYGTIRAVGLSEKLFDSYCISLNGIILISSALDLQTILQENDLAFSLAIPSFAAAAWYHKKLAPELQEKPLDQLLKEVEQFVSDELTCSYFKGDKLTSEDQQEVAAKLSYYTGLSKEYILRDDLRVSSLHFFKELLRDEGKIVGRFDARFVAQEGNGNGESIFFDPSSDFIAGQFTAAHQSLLLKELGWNKNEPYIVSSGKIFPWKWDYKSQGTKPYSMNLLETLKLTMSREPNMKVFLVEGYYDLATPYFAANYCVSHLFLPPELEKNISIHAYKAGHMVYLHEESCKALSCDLEKFMTSPQEKVSLLEKEPAEEEATVPPSEDLAKPSTLAQLK